MFTFTDMLAKMNCPESGRGIELFSENNTPHTLTGEEVKKLFPLTQFSPSPSVVYAPLKMCHSLPTINLRGRCFTPRVLANSYASALHNLVDIEHELIGNNTSPTDNICGHISAVSLGESFQWKDAKEVASAELADIPTEPIPMYALMTLFMRHSQVPDLVKNHMNGTDIWKGSMECGHDWANAEFLYRNEFIPIKDADPAMRECVGRMSVQDYKGHPLAVAIGGRNKSVDYYGVAVTRTPADKSANVLCMISGASMELASKGTLYLPIHMQQDFRSSHEAASEKFVVELEHHVDKVFNDLAKISVMGQTDPDCAGGHVHDILSDGVIVPTNGHGHSMANYNIDKGTRPTMTGHTNVQYDYKKDPATGDHKESSHMHNFSIDLRGSKTKSSSSSFNSEHASVESLSNLYSSLCREQGTEEIMDLTALFAKVDAALGKLSTVKSADGKTTDSEFASVVTGLRSDIASFKLDDEIKARVKTEIANLVTSGDLVEKGIHEAALKAQHDADLKLAADQATAVTIRTDRAKKLTDLGVDLEGSLPNDGTQTIQQTLDLYPLDDMGNKLFNSYYASVKSLVDVTKAGTQAGSTEELQAAELASKAEAAQKKPKPFMLAGGGEAAQGAGAAGGGGTANENASAAKGGKDGIKSF